MKISDKDGHSVPAEGVPYALTRSEYFISRTPPAEGERKPTYTFVVKQEIDPTQRYTLKIDPATFANPDFVVKLTANGTLLSTTSTMTDQIGPTITALGTFAKDVVAITATGLLDKNSAKSEIGEQLKGGTCDIATDALWSPLPARPKKPTTGELLKERIGALKDDDEFAALFHYATSRDKICLEEARTRLAEAWTRNHKPVVDAWDAAKAAYLATHPEEQGLVDELATAVKAQDKITLERIINENAKVADEATRRQKQTLAAAATKAATSSEAAASRDALDAILKMSDATWRARQVVYLERMASAFQLARLRDPDASNAHRKDYDEFAARLALRRADVLGTTVLQDRADALSAFLRSVPDKAVLGGRAPAAAEYATVRAELDVLNAAIEARRTKVMADAAPPAPPKVTALRDERVVRVSRDCLNSAAWSDRAKGCLDEFGRPHPYVVVLKEVE